MSLQYVDQSQLIRDYASIDFVYSALPKIEEQIIIGLNQWFQVLKDEQYYNEVPEVTAIYPKEKAKYHAVIVECFSGSTQSEGIGDNKQLLIHQPDGTTYEEYQIRSATLKYSADIKCRSTSRQSVSKLADAILLGLLTEVKDALRVIDITIKPNSITFSNRITRVELVKDTAVWEIVIAIAELQTHWKQILTTEGEILKGIKYLIDN